jgi:hypothetical protein
VIFEDIPYAKPPVGSLRWKAPAWPEVADTVLNEGGTLYKLPQYQAGWVNLAIPFITKYLTDDLADSSLETPKGPDDYPRPPTGGPEGTSKPSYYWKYNTLLT